MYKFCFYLYPLNVTPIMKRLIISLILIFLVISSFGQKVSNEKPPLRERMFFGGYFGLQFGTITNIDISPTVGVWVMPRVAIALGPSFQYYADPYGDTFIYGGSTYLQLTILQDLNNILPVGIHMGIFGQVEYEGLSLEKSYITQMPDAQGRVYSDVVLLGAGISQSLGGRSSINLSFLWALTQSDYIQYGSPEIRVSFNF
jgi:hypothetical protein